jgi:hypothetical protein
LPIFKGFSEKPRNKKMATVLTSETLPELQVGDRVFILYDLPTNEYRSDLYKSVFGRDSDFSIDPQTGYRLNPNQVTELRNYLQHSTGSRPGDGVVHMIGRFRLSRKSNFRDEDYVSPSDEEQIGDPMEFTPEARAAILDLTSEEDFYASNLQNILQVLILEEQSTYHVERTTIHLLMMIN